MAKRIAHITWSFGGFQEGISRSVTELALGQIAAGHQVEIFAARISDCGFSGETHIPGLTRLERRLPFVLGFASASARAVRRAERQSGAFDILHSHVPTLAKTDVATVHLYPPKQLLALVKDTLTRTGQPISDGIKRQFRSAWIARWTYARNMSGQAHLIAVSPRVAQALQDCYGRRPDEITTLPLGIAPPPVDLTPQPRPDGPDRVAVFIGHQYITKGLGFVIEAMAQLGDDAPFLVVLGEGSEGSRSAMEQFAREKGLSHKIRFDGPQPQVWSHLAMADLLIYPTFFDTFGLIIGEALAAGCPVITSRAAGITDLLPQTPALHLVDRAEDVDGLTQALRTLPSGPEISAAARQAVTDLSWNAHLDGVEEVYDKTVRSR